MASENENLTQSIRPKSEILGTGLSDPDCTYRDAGLCGPKTFVVLLLFTTIQSGSLSPVPKISDFGRID